MAREGKKSARAEWCSAEEGHLLLPGLDMDTALRCLAFVPSYIYPLLASLSKTYRSLIISARCAPLMEVRRTLGIVDYLLVSKHKEDVRRCDYETVYINGEEHMQAKIKWNLRVLDLKRKSWMNLAVPRFLSWQHYDTFFCSGTRLFCCSYSLRDASMYYDFALHEWEIGRCMPEPTRRFWCAFAASGDCCFVAGGHKTNGYELSSGFALSSAEVYNMRKWSSDPLPPMPAGRDLCAGCIMDDKFYVIGGTDGKFQCYVDAEEYDPSTMAWKNIPNMCLSASCEVTPLVAVHKNQLYAIDDDVSTPSNPSLHVFEKETNTWRCLGPVLDKHEQGNLYMRNGGLISMNSDKLLVVGEWRPKIQGGQKEINVLAWDASVEATVCEFKIVYSGPAEWDMSNEMQQHRHEESRFRLRGKPWLAVVI